MSFDDIEFIGWDGEGITEGKIDEWTEKQKLVLISVSTGESLYKEEGISFDERLNFVRRIGIRHPHATHVFYGGSYDFNKILEGLPPAKIDELHQSSKRWVVFDRWIFSYRPRKELVIAHLKDGVRFNRKAPLRPQCDSFVRLWDVIGFFQSSFLHAVKTWLGPDYPDYELIASGKIERLSFTGDKREFMIEYNMAEVRALVEIMNRLHSKLKQLGLKISRWDGAGAIAAEIFKRYHLTDAYSKPLPNSKKREKFVLEKGIEEAARYAFFGGRIESAYIGRYVGDVYNYDINSAYPFAAYHLPNLNRGEWKHHDRLTAAQVMEMNDFSFIRVQWYFHTDRPYYPFPFRCLGGAVIFPKKGERWICTPEVKSAIRSMLTHDKMFFFEAWEFQERSTGASKAVERSVSSINPFHIIYELYMERQQMVAVKDAAELVLKLGLNSLYGKLCQKLGWNEKTRQGPRYHFLPFAAFITSTTRARIYDSIQNCMSDVIAINTDGVVSKDRLPVGVSTNKEFGKWSLEMNDEVVQLQSGVYWLRKGEWWKEKARGLGRVVGKGDTEPERKADQNQQIIGRLNQIFDGWKNKDEKAYFPVKQFITSKKARTGPDWLPRWGHWYIMHDSKSGRIGRGVELKCSGWGKRRLMTAINPNALNATVASENITWKGERAWKGGIPIGIDDPKIRDLGEQYDLPWLNYGITPEEEFIDDGDLQIG